MKEHVDNTLDKSKSESKITAGINTMLECLLSENKTARNRCKVCEKIEACSYLIESIFAYENTKREA